MTVGMDVGDDNLAEAMRIGWQTPVRQLGLIDIEKAPWLGEAVIKCYQLGMDNSRIATVLRTIDGPMSIDERRTRGLKSSARLSASFFDALTADGQIDPVFTSRCIVSRVMRSGTWVLDLAGTMNLTEGWTVMFTAGPKCCDWAIENNLSHFSGPISVPHPSCNKPYCTCRAVATPPEPPTNYFQVVGAIVAFIAMAALLAIVGGVLR